MCRSTFNNIIAMKQDSYSAIVIRPCRSKFNTNTRFIRFKRIHVTYLASLPDGYDGEFGPGIKALVMSLYYGRNMTQGKLLEFLEDIGISMSAGYLSNLLKLMNWNWNFGYFLPKKQVTRG